MAGVMLYDYQLDAINRMKIGCILSTMQRFAKYIANAMEKDMMKDMHLDFIKGS